MISIIYPFRNRELSRIKNSLDSLVIQSNKAFKVIFVDYGSEEKISHNVQELVQQYEFVSYIYSYNIYQPWSRSKAINIGLKNVDTEYVFISDIDIIFNNQFVDKLYDLVHPNKSIYFQVGYLSENESKQSKNFEDYEISSKSIPEGQGLSLFRLDSLKEINGFDEFFHFWGAEDEDVHSRLNNNRISTTFFDNEILLLHQWHPIFESSENKDLTVEPLLSGIFTLNKQKLRFNQKNKLIKVNNNNWGSLFNKQEYDILKSDNNCQIVLNKKNNIDNFINIVLPNTNSKIINVCFKTDNYQESYKHKIKRFLKIKTSEYYSLKHINDLILLNLILHYRDCPYIFKINSDMKSIIFIIKK